MNKKYNRKIIFINKELQGKLIFTYFMFALFTLFLFVAVSMIISSDYLTISYSNNRISVQKSVIVMLKDMLSTNWIVLFTAGIGISYLAMKITHRIAGPLYRFEKTLEAMNEKKLDVKIVLRDKDECVSVAEDFNKFNKMLSDDLSNIELICGDESLSYQERLESVKKTVSSYKKLKENR